MQEIPVVLIGHKDHGKSTSIGRLILDTGSIKESRLKEVKEVDESDNRKFELAHLIDSFRQERDREMTMDTSRALLKGRKRNYQLIDVPGHGELIANMLTGAAGAEAALLLIDIKEGIKEQTSQHLEAAKLLGIEQLGVMVNKMDKVDYRKEAFEEIKEKLKTILVKIGYSAERIRFFPISAWQGDNLVKKSEKMNWYQGPTVMEFLEEEIKTPKSLADLDLIFINQDNYDGILAGRIESGRLKLNQEVLLLPEKKKLKVISIQDSSGRLSEAEAGQNVGLLLSENLNCPRGRVIASLNSRLKAGREIGGEIFWLEKPKQKNLILECGTAQAEGKLQEPELINQGAKTSYRILLKKEIVFEPEGKTILGKIVLKEGGEIIAVGNIS